jgi:hypothetical protein
MQVEEFKKLVELLTGRPVRTKPSDDAFLTRALKNDEATIDCSQFNELLLIANKDRIEEAFFDFFFVEKGSATAECRIKDIRDGKDIRAGVKKFQKSAMLCFGNFIYAFRKLSKIRNLALLKQELGDHCRDIAQLVNELSGRRKSILDIVPIGDDKTYLLGYISSGEIREEHKIGINLDELLRKRVFSDWQELTAALEGLKTSVPDPAVIEGSLKLIERFRRGASKDSVTDFKLRLERDLPSLKQLHQTLGETEASGNKNTDVYLTWDRMDIYFATSMRKQWEYEDLFAFVHKVTEKERIPLADNKTLKELNIRHFDPTQSFDKNRINKGLVEALMLRRAGCTVYSVQDTDTLGKDSELAATLAQGKPVIAYAPVIKVEERVKALLRQHPATLRERLQFVLYADERVLASDVMAIREFLVRLDRFVEARLWRSLSDSNELARFQRENQEDLERLCRIIAGSEERIYDKRAATLQKTHPLAIQVNLDTGVANGVIVARNEKTCAELIWRILTNTLDFDIKYDEEKDCWLLIEELTKSIYRVVTNNPKLTNCFWNFYPERDL